MTASEIQTLITSASCNFCLTGGSLADVIKMELLNQMGTGGAGVDACFQSGNYGGGQPTYTPTCDVGMAFDTSTVPATQWLYYNGAWH